MRMTLEFPNGSSFGAEGYLAIDEHERRMEWGAESERDYSGWLTVGNHGEGGSEVVVHLSFGERSVEDDIQGARRRTATRWRRGWTRRSSPSAGR